MSTTVDDVLVSLEWRLNRLEHVLQGTNAAGAVTSNAFTSGQLSIPVRLAALDKRMSALAKESPVVSDLLRLRASLPDSINNGTLHADDSRSSEVNKVAVVLASAQTFYAAQSNLTSLEGIKLEDASILIPLAEMQQNVVTARAAQQAQETEVGELRERTARLLAQWHQTSVLIAGEQLAGWEERLLDIEKVIRRREVAQARDGIL